MSWKTSIAIMLASLALVFAVGACGGEDEGSGEESLVLELDEEDGSGQSGTATLTPVGDSETRVALTLTNPPAEAQPSHIHSGRCGDMGDPVAPLESLEDGKAETVVDLSLSELQRGNLVVHAHKSDAESEISVACADIPAAN